MADLAHLWGGDLTLSATGDLLPADGLDRDNQRIIRRLCTRGSGSPGTPTGEYLFHLDYGAALPRYVGATLTDDQILGIARAQMRKEEAVAQSPEPSMAVRQSGLGYLTLDISYTDQPTKSVRSLSFDVTR